MSEDTLRRVISVIAQTQRIPPESIHPDSTFEELKIDSLDGINIVFAIENEFDINVHDDAAKSIRSIRDMAEGVERLLGTRSDQSAEPAQDLAAPMRDAPTAIMPENKGQDSKPGQKRTQKRAAKAARKSPRKRSGEA